MIHESCTDCGVTLDRIFTGKKYIDGLPYCKKCYYARFGEVVEQHPIGGPLISPQSSDNRQM